MNLKSSKTLGGIGAILMVISVLPYISQIPFIGLIGNTCFGCIASLRYVPYKESGIFSNALYGIPRWHSWRGFSCGN